MGTRTRKAPGPAGGAQPKARAKAEAARSGGPKTAAARPDLESSTAIGFGVTVQAAFFAEYHGFAEAGQHATRVPALITLAQAALESGWGRHAPRNNFFGIKAKATDPPATRQLLQTTEVLSTPNAHFPVIISVTRRHDGRYLYVVKDWFRAYPTPAEAFIAHGRFLRDNSRYASAFEHTDDPEAFAVELQKDGYATDPDYAKKLISIMRQLAGAHV
jgi:flagellum-specific peptidoglycan hydrolase FlgJ